MSFETDYAQQWYASLTDEQRADKVMLLKAIEKARKGIRNED